MYMEATERTLHSQPNHNIWTQAHPNGLQRARSELESSCNGGDPLPSSLPSSTFSRSPHGWLQISGASSGGNPSFAQAASHPSSANKTATSSELDSAAPTAQQTFRAVAQFDDQKRTALEHLFGVPKSHSSDSPSPEKQSARAATSGHTQHQQNQQAGRSTLFGALSAAISGTRQPAGFATGGENTFQSVSSNGNHHLENGSTSFRNSSFSMSSDTDDPAFRDPAGSTEARQRAYSVVGQAIPSYQQRSTSSSRAAAGGDSQPASMPTNLDLNWDLRSLGEGSRLQRRLSQREASPASPKSPGTRNLDGWAPQRRQPDPLLEDEDGFEGGMASTNVSPFTRDGRMPLPPLGSFATAGSPTGRPREHSLGPVGSGRRYKDNSGSNAPSSAMWNGPASATSRTFVFDENDSDDDFAPTRSGATSRRHSLATFPGTSQYGFHVPPQQSHSSDSSGGGGSSNFSPSSTGPKELLPSGSRNQGSGSLRFEDDELAESINSLQLSLNQRGSTSTSATSQPSSSFKSPPPSQQTPLPSGASPNAQRSSSFSARSPQAPSFEPMGVPPPSMPYAQAVSPRGTSATLPRPGAGAQQTPFYVGGAPPSRQQHQPMRNAYAGSGVNRGLSATAQPFHGFQHNQGHDASAMPVYFGAQPQQEPDLAEFGRGVPLHQIPPESKLYIIEFKAGRTDIFFLSDPSLQVGTTDVVIVEADRGKDLGTVVHDNISLQDVQAFQKHQVEQALSQLAASQAHTQAPNPQTISRLTREVHPKRILSRATPTDLQLLSSKAADEAKALALCRSKVMQKNLDMLMTDAEWQFDRRKLTLFYIADKRIDFRELVRELFRLFKTRIWMSPVEKVGEGPTPAGRF